VTYLEGRNGDTNDLLLDARLDGFNQNANDSIFPEEQTKKVQFPNVCDIGEE